MPAIGNHLAGVLLTGCLAAGSAIAIAGDSSTQPAQSDLDFLLSQSKGAATQPANDDQPPTTQPRSPFDSGQAEGARTGSILLSNGEKSQGLIAHTARKPVRVWVAEQSEYKDIPFSLIQSIEAKVVWERQEPEWHFKESGSDIKEYSGKTYPARATEYSVTLADGSIITGGVVEPLYLLTSDGSSTFVLHKRDKGEVGQSLEKLVYVKRVDFTGSGATTQPGN